MKIVVVCSGGMDSVTLAHFHHAQHHEVALLSVHYGQRHSTELKFARECADRLGLVHRMVDLAPLKQLFGPSSQTDASVAVPHGHYAAESMKQTVVPNRNMILLSVAAAWAMGMKFDAVSFGAHSGDHAIYPDCRPEFVDAMDRAVMLADWHPVKILRPFVGMSKATIAAIGRGLRVPYDRTWSCYEGGAMHCGKCGTCVERREAFAVAGILDPTAYAA